MLATLYRGSVKDVKGPVQIGGETGVVFDYSDAYSVFDWGRMPDALPRKGEALALLAAGLFERLERPETWQEFSRSSEALGLRKANRFGSAFVELGEELKQAGLRTHYLGVIPRGKSDVCRPTGELAGSPPEGVFVRQVGVVKPAFHPILGRATPDYLPLRSSPLPRLVPLEVVFRFSCPGGSSLFERVERDPEYLASLGFGHLRDGGPLAAQRWDFPLLELFTKLEPADRPVNLTEGLAISGLSARQLQQLLFRTAWTAGCLKWIAARAGLELADGKVEWGLDACGELMLVDAIGPDELRLLRDGVQLSKEFLRAFYRETEWYRRVGDAKRDAKAQGTAEWKKLVAEGPPPLPVSYKEAATQLYLALTNDLSGRTWFPDAWKLERVVTELRALDPRPGSLRT